MTRRQHRQRWARRAAALAVLVVLGGLPARASDADKCLLCHRYRGLGRVGDDGKSVRLYHVDPAYYDEGLGPHARLRCTDCHARDFVGVIPHQPVPPVDCSRACHLTSPDKPPRDFSHDRIAAMLASSVHTQEVLAECNKLLGTPLKEGQSTCLLCHEEPTFHRRGDLAADDKAMTARCDVCHADGLAQDSEFALHHVQARIRPARSNKELTGSCALCHSNLNVRRRFALPDTVATYLASFHGKAMLLGSEKTAGCLDCHVGELQNVHLMHTHRDADAATNPARLPDTCRSSACHPGAGALVTAASVHMELTPSILPPDGDAAQESPPTENARARRQQAGGRFTIEFGIAVLFVFLIMGTFGPSALFQVMELLQLVLHRHDANHPRNLALARQLMAAPEGRRRLKRFTVHQRVQHWLLFSTFTLLALTGFPIKFADRGWAAWMIGVFGGLSAARRIHRWAGLVLVAGAAYHACYVAVTALQRKRRENLPWHKVILGLPLVVNLNDLRELRQLLGFLFFLRRTRPESGRFGLKEKFEYFGVFWGCALLGVTGLMMWANAWTSQYFTGRVLTAAALVHTLEAFLALLHVGLFHMIGAIFSPHVAPLSPAMFTGDTPHDELAEAHAGMLATTAAALGVKPATELTHD